MFTTKPGLKQNMFNIKLYSHKILAKTNRIQKK